MKRNIFELVNSDFFNPFTSKYKKINYDLLVLINDAMMEESLSLERAEIVDIIDDYFKSCPNLCLYDEAGNEVNINKQASDYIRYFTKCGWMSYELTSDFKEMYQMEPVALDMLEAMSNIIEDDSSPLESSGYVYSIYKNLVNFDLSKATETTEQIALANKRLSSNLRSVTARIKKYLNNLLKKDNQNPEKILYELLSNYQNNVVARSFNNLRTRDNPSKYKEAILSSIDRLERECMDDLIKDYIEVKCNSVDNADNREEAEVFYLKVFYALKRQFENIAGMIDGLEGKNTQYVTSATSRVSFLLNEKDNLEGKIDQVLRLLETKKVNDDDCFEFDSNQLLRIDDSSLYMHTRIKKPDPTLLDVEAVPMSEEEIKNYEAILARQNRFTIRGVDNFILESLKDNKQIKASDIKLESFDDFMMLFLACIYAQSEIVHYQITPMEGEIRFEDRQLENFNISRRDTYDIN